VARKLSEPTWEDKMEVRHSWSNFLGTLHDWNGFLTVTFRIPRYPWQAISTLTAVKSTIVRSGIASAGFLATELHQSRAIHVHGLLAWSSQQTLSNPSSMLWRDLYMKFGRTKIETPAKNELVAMYVTKYVTKDTGEFMIW